MRQCTQLWGDAALYADNLGVSVIENAIYMPFSDLMFCDVQPDWGIYTEDGRIVEASAYQRGAGLALVGQSALLDLAGIDIDDAPFAEMLYGGPLIAHYGHFVLSSLSRFHALSDRVPTLLHSSPAVFDHGSAYIRDYVAAAGLTRSNCFSFARPTRIKRLLVPQASLIEQNRVSPVYAHSLAELGERFSSDGTFDGARIYLSKSRLIKGIAGFHGEDEVEHAYEKAGFSIVYPERLTISQQVNLFRSAATVVGSVSSGVHTLALSPYARSLRVVFNYADFVNSNFALLDMVSSGRSVYYSMSEAITLCPRQDFFNYYSLLEPAKVAVRMVSATLEAERVHRGPAAPIRSILPIARTAKPTAWSAIKAAPGRVRRALAR